jgi:methyl-accepting chemotaxis protein
MPRQRQTHADGMQVNMPPRAAGGSALSEFFRWHGIWAPGVRLFRAIGFRTKAMIISMVFLLPIAQLGWQYFGAVAEKIAIEHNERVGTQMLAKFAPVLHGVIDTRNATRAMLGNFDASKEYGSARARTDAALLELQKVLDQVGDELALQSAVTQLKEAWAKTASSKTGADAEGRTVFGPVTAAAVELLNQIGDKSNLVLDPDLDSFYLVNALVLTLPKTMEDAGQIWGWGTFATVRAGIGTEHEAQWHVWEARLQSGLADLRGQLARVALANPQLKARLEAPEIEAALLLRKAGHAAVFDADVVKADVYFAQGKAAVGGLASLYERWIPLLDELLAAREARNRLVQAWTIGVLSLSLTVALYLFLSFQKVLDGGLREVAFHIDAMRDGNLTTRPRAWGSDEAARLMITLQQMQQSLTGIVSHVRGASDSIVSASSEIAGGANDLHQRTEVSAANLEETASAMEQVAATVKSNAATVDEASRLAQANSAAAARGGRIIGEVVATMESINASSSRIGDIIGTIQGIAFQTNILALNAAVEAARAGEQGRGFAVVASEVRALAQRSSASAREIKSLVSNSVENVETGVRVVKEAGSVIDEIVGTSSRVRELLVEVAVGAREQTAGVSQSALAVQELDTVTQQNAALVEQTAAAASSLQERARALAGEVARFKLAEAA